MFNKKIIILILIIIIILSGAIIVLHNIQNDDKSDNMNTEIIDLNDTIPFSLTDNHTGSSISGNYYIFKSDNNTYVRIIADFFISQSDSLPISFSCPDIFSFEKGYTTYHSDVINFRSGHGPFDHRSWVELGNISLTTTDGGKGFTDIIFKYTDYDYSIPDKVSFLLTIGTSNESGQRSSGAILSTDLFFLLIL